MNCARSITAHSVRPSISCSGPAALSRGLRVPAGRPASAEKLRTIESMPFQTYQLALDVIRKDHEEKMKAVARQRKKISLVVANSGDTPNVHRITELKQHLEYLQVQADINNPRVKYCFDRGIYRLNKPVYRFLANQKWREYRRPILIQRLTQMHVVPDVLPVLDPVVDVQLRFRGYNVQPGMILDSLQTQVPPTFKVIPFTTGQMLCTVLVVDSDVPDFARDRFSYQLHWLVSNIPISPLQTQAIGTGAKPSDTIVEWLPPHVQRGSPYHRYAVIVFRQSDKIDAEALKGKIRRSRFNTRSFQALHKLTAIGAHLFRGEWDEHTAQVMQRHGLEGWDRMLVRTKDV